MNPIQWLKTIYETFGTPYPRASLIVVMVLGALVAGTVWHFAAKQVEKDRSVSGATVPPTVTGSATTTGENSPAVTGSGNDVHYDQTVSPEKKPSAPKKE